MSRRLFTATAFTILAACAVIAPAAAVTVSPMHVEMTSSGTRSHTTVTVVNDGAVPLPIEAVVKRMTLDESGAAKITEAGDEFLIMPPQTIIAPGATQNFRVQWLGEPMLGASQSFYVFFNQVPVKPTAGRSTIQVVMSIGTLVNVAPPQGTAALSVVETGLTPPDKSGRRFPTVTVLNSGKVHALFTKSTVRISGTGFDQTLPPGLLGEKLGSGLVQPGARRRFTLPVEVPANAGALRTVVDMPQKRN